MASDRPIYDQGVYTVKTKESIKPLSYMLQINAHENCKVCGDKPNVTKHEERINLENDIFGLQRKTTRDPSTQYKMNPLIAKTLNYVPPYLCERSLNHSSFINNTDTNNKYMEDLRKTSVPTIEIFEDLENLEGFGKSSKSKGGSKNTPKAASKNTPRAASPGGPMGTSLGSASGLSPNCNRQNCSRMCCKNFYG